MERRLRLQMERRAELRAEREVMEVMEARQATSEIPMTVGMFLSLLERCRKTVTVIDGGPGGMDGYISVVDHDALVTELRKEADKGLSGIM